MYFLAKYGVQTSFRFSMIKRGVVDLAATADWTPATGDSKISLNGATVGNTTNLPTAIAGAGSVGWNIVLSAAELTTQDVYVQIVDSATKAVEDNSFVVYTYGNAAAKIPVDLSETVRLGLTALPNAAAEAAGGLYTRGTGAGQINQPANGMVDGNVVRWLNTAVATPITAGIPRVAIEAASDFIQAAADKVWASATRTLTAFSLTLAQSIWDVLETSIVAAGSIGLKVKTNLDATISSRSPAGTDTPGTTTLLARIIGTLAAGTHQPQSGDAFARLGAPAGASVSADIATRLAPTVAGRTLDVTTTGEAGIDWANIGAPTTAQTLSGTTIATTQAIASVSGAVGSVTGNVGGNVNGSVASMAANGISAASLAADSGQKPIRSGTAQAGSTTTTIVLDAGASAVDDFYKNTWVYLTGNTGVGQLREIRTYTGTSKTAAIVRPWATGLTPDNTSTFAILPAASVWDEFVADHFTAGTFGNVSGQQLTTSELLDNVVGPLATVLAGANTTTVLNISVPSVVASANDWWKGALISFDNAMGLGAQWRKIIAYTQTTSTTGVITVDLPFTGIAAIGATARLVVR